MQGDGDDRALSVPDYAGSIYAFKGVKVAGWLADRVDLRRRVEFELLIDGESRGAFVADRPRASLRNVGLGDGRYGFDIPAEEAGRIEVGSQIEIRPMRHAVSVARHKVRFVPTPVADPMPAAPAAIPAKNASPDEAAAPNIADATAPAQPPKDAGRNASEPVVSAEPPVPVAAAVPSDNDATEKSAPEKSAPEETAPAADKALSADSTAEPVIPVAKEAPRKRDDAISLQKITAYLSELDDQACLKELTEVVQRTLTERIRPHFRSKNWGWFQDAGVFADNLLSSKLLASIGRGELYAGSFAAAQQHLSKASESDPDSGELAFYCGLAYLRDRRGAEALPYLRLAAAQDQSAKILLELVRAIRLVMRDDASAAATLSSELIEVSHKLMALDPKEGHALQCARLLYEIGAYDDALVIAEMLPTETNVDLMIVRSRCMVALNRIADALDVSDAVLRADPLNPTAGYYKRTLPALVRVAERKLATMGLYPGGEAETVEEAMVAMARDSHDWFIVGAPDADVEHWAAEIGPERLALSAGYQEVETADGALRLWHKDALAKLMTAELVGADLATLDKYSKFFRRDLVSPPVKGRVIVMSRHGNYKFGGGEHFLESMAGHYASRGLEPIIVGMRPEMQGDSGVNAAGFRFVFIDNEPASLFRLIAEEDVSLIHAISGAGFIAATAIDRTNVKMVYGIHYWREFLGDDSARNFFAEDGSPNPRPEFRYILARAASVYANSHYTRSLLEKTFGVRAPTVFSVPSD